MNLKSLLFSDLYRITGKATWSHLARQFVAGETYRYVAVMRITAAAAGRPGFAGKFGGLAGRVWLRRLRIRQGINVPWSTRIGPGFFIGHAGGIVVNAGAKLGRDVNISHNVTIGVANGGKRPGVPTIGDRVYIGPGAVLVGGITIGNDVAIGANTVVTKDVPDGSTVVGNPGDPRPGEGSAAAYIHRTTEGIVA